MLLREIGKLSAQRDDLRWLDIGCIDEGNQSRVEKYGYVFHAVGWVEMARCWSTVVFDTSNWSQMLCYLHTWVFLGPILEP